MIYYVDVFDLLSVIRLFDSCFLYCIFSWFEREHTVGIALNNTTCLILVSKDGRFTDGVRRWPGQQLHWLHGKSVLFSQKQILMFILFIKTPCKCIDLTLWDLILINVVPQICDKRIRGETHYKIHVTTLQHLKVRRENPVLWLKEYK